MVDMDLTAQKLFNARKCPRCGSPLFPPFNDKWEDLICKHCKLKIKWIKEWIAVEEEEE